MSPVTVPYHLVIPAAFCAVCLAMIVVGRRRLFGRRRGRRWLWISIVVFLSVYLLIVGSAAVEDVYAQWDLNRYDLDGDGFFGGAELTKQQAEAMARLVNDVGRNFSVITGLLFSFVVSVTVYSIAVIGEKVTKG
ncbi:MAG: hypothetical protein AAFQ74_15060 [Cyanobacteria bacterium J06623_4]